MSPRSLIVGLVPLLCLALIGCNGQSRNVEPVADVADAESQIEVGGAAMRITGPHVKDNLAIYLIHAPDRVAGAKYLTLQEAMEQKKVVVHETGNVNELAIENLADEDVYIQSGEIVKGGKQDRTIGTDMIITRSMGKTPIASFCVEHGRWQSRGGENVAAFSGSSGYVAGKAMKRASNTNYREADQQAVWQSVRLSQASLSRSVAADVQASTSPSSFQLTLENEKLNEKVHDYLKSLEPAAKD